MDGYAALCASGIEHRTVNPVAIHSLSTEPGQKGRVNVHNPSTILVDNITRNQPHEPCQNHYVSFPPAQHHKYLSGGVKLRPVEKKCIHSQCRSPFQYHSLRHI